MIKFFRKIRLTLMEQNKTGKYLKYALGEILLVMIGILLALQVNNWNTLRLERKLEIKILKEIQSNLETDVKNLKAKIEENDLYLKANINVLTHLKDKTKMTGTLEKDYASILGHGNFRAVTVGYDNLKSEGISILSNDSLRNAIAELYDYKYYNFTENIYYAVVNLRALQAEAIADNINTIDPYVKAIPFNLTELYDNKRFQEIANWWIHAINYINFQFQTGINEIKSVQVKLNEELERLESS